jgi:hypothetical protein
LLLQERINARVF